MKELLSTFFYILYKFYLCVSKIQVRATTVFEFYFWSLLEQHVHTFKFFKPHFWKDFITKLILFLLQQCLSLLSLSLSLFFLLLLAPNFCRGSWDSRKSEYYCLLFLKLLSWGQKCIQVLKERKYLPNWKSHQEDCFPAYQEKQPCDFSLRSVFRSNLTRCGFESQLCCLPVGWRRADYPDS